MGKQVSANPETFSAGSALLQPGKHPIEVIAGSRFITMTGGKDADGKPIPPAVSWKLALRTLEDGGSDTSWHYRLGDRKYIAPSNDGKEIVPDDAKGNEEGMFVTTVEDDRDAFRISENSNVSHLISSAVELGVPGTLFDAWNADCLVGLKGSMLAKTVKREGLGAKAFPVFHEITAHPGGAKSEPVTKKEDPAEAVSAGTVELSEDHKKIGSEAAKQVLSGKDDGLPLRDLGVQIFKVLAGKKLKPADRVKIKKAFSNPEFVKGLGDEWLFDEDSGSLLYAG